jgi:hypothetical protein
MKEYKIYEHHEQAAQHYDQAAKHIAKPPSTTKRAITRRPRIIPVAFGHYLEAAEHQNNAARQHAKEHS